MHVIQTLKNHNIFLVFPSRARTIHLGTETLYHADNDPNTNPTLTQTLIGTGKLYHADLPPNNDPVSWTNNSIQYPAWNHGKYVAPGMLTCNVTEAWHGQRWCAVDDDEWFIDRNVTNDAIIKLQYAAAQIDKQPFFLGVGLRKPHLDWRVPKSVMAKYPDYTEIALPTRLNIPDNMPEVARSDRLGSGLL